MRQVSVILLVLISVNLAFADVPPPPEKGGDNTAAEPWWSETDAGWIGGGLGGTVGILGAVFGVCAGLGVARRLVLSFALLMIALGVLLLVSGMAAAASGQPYHVYYPLLLIGGISSFVFGFNYPFVKRRYEQIELQRISALDA